MDTQKIIGLVLLVVIIGGVSLLLGRGEREEPGVNASATIDTIITSGGIAFRYATSTYALATSTSAVSVKSYIPPCDAAFEYCIYRSDSAYKGTNFESAGLRVKARPDLVSRSACLSTPPDGFNMTVATTRDGNGYSTGSFAPIGSAAAGHYAAGALYRLSIGTLCYEFETRIAENLYSNYPKGTIEQFTDADRAMVYSGLVQVLNTATLADINTPIIFPSLEEGIKPEKK